MRVRTANVRYWSEIGLNADIGLWAGFDPGCVKTHTLKECGKYNSPTRNRAVYPQHDLTLMMRNFLEDILRAPQALEFSHGQETQSGHRPASKRAVPEIIFRLSTVLTCAGQNAAVRLRVDRLRLGGSYRDAI
jgi:hypothetical protein